jgi:hypothetical protein
MYRRFQNRFGTAGVIVAVVALIVALSGTALAASGALTGKQKKEVEKIAKKYAGKPGTPGAAGANGTNGTNGKDGSNGTSGKDGLPGKSVTLVNSAPPNCSEGGFTYEVQGSGQKNEVCNGEEGEVGEPWTASGTLPPGATETGAWFFSGSSGEVAAPISFPVPLAAVLEVENTHVVTAIGDSTCTGTMEIPKAPPGELCVYESGGGFPNATREGVYHLSAGAKGADTSGALIYYLLSGASSGGGSFAVTGCSATPGPNVCP